MDEATAHAMQYMALTDAMGYEAGADALAPEEYAAALRKDAERYRWLKYSKSLVWPSVDLANACHRAKQTGSGAPIDAEIDRQMAWPAVGAA